MKAHAGREDRLDGTKAAAWILVVVFLMLTWYGLAELLEWVAE